MLTFTAWWANKPQISAGIRTESADGHRGSGK